MTQGILFETLEGEEFYIENIFQLLYINRKGIKMKKILFIFLFTLFFCANMFAKAKTGSNLIISITQGYNNMSTILSSYTMPGYKISSHNGNLYFTSGLILDNGFTFLEHLGFGVGRAYLDIYSSFSVLFESHSVIGYTFKPTPNAYINLLSGFGTMVGYPQFVQTGIPIHLGFQYYFGQKAGLNITAIEMIGLWFPVFLTNSFTIKAGVSFRL